MKKERMFDLISEYVLKGCDADELTTIYSNEKQRAKFEEYVAQGIEPAQAQIFITYKIFPNETKKIERFYMMPIMIK